MNKFLFVALLFAAACDSPGATFGDMGPLPADCESRCPAGYTCDNGTCVGGDPSALAFDVKTFAVDATLTVDGQPPVAGAGCSGDHVRVQFAEGPLPKSFLDPVLGTLVTAPLACTDNDGAVATRLPAGKYRVLASRSDTNTTFPDATTVAQRQLAIAGDTAPLVWDIPTVSVSGRITVDGQPPVAGAGCSGDHVRLTFLDDSGATFTAPIPCSEQNGAFSLRVAPGTYRVLASRSDTNTTFPDATIVAQRSFDVSGAAPNLAWDIPTASVSGTLTIDGQPPVAGAGCSGDHVRVTFLDDSGATFTAPIACGVSTGAFSLRVAQGTYRVLASRSDTNTTFPDATVVVQPSFQVGADASGLAWDVTTVPVSGTIAVDGQAPVAGAGCSGDHVRVSFLDDNGATFTAPIACSVSTGAFSLRLAPSKYRVLASRSDTNTTFPDATVVLDAAFQLSAAVLNHAWNVATVPLSGTLAVDGQAPVAGAGCSGDHVRVSFFDATGARYTYAIPCSESTGAFSLRVASGTYGIVASRSDTNTTFPDGTLTLVNALAVP